MAARGVRGRRCAASALLAAAWIGAWTAPALAASASPTSGPSPSASPSPAVGPAPGGGADQVVLLGRVVVPRGQSVGEVVVFSGRVVVEGLVRGDVVVVSGPITVSGQVSGSVIALDGSIHLQGTAQVGGDVLARDQVVLDAGARVSGSARQDVRFTLSHPLRALGDLISWVAVAVSMLIVGMGFAILAPRALARTATAARTAPAAAIGWGVVLAVLVPVLAVGAVASVAALPLGLAVLLAVALMMMVGAAVTAHAVGRALVGGSRPPAVAYLAGWGIATAIGVVPYVSGIVFVLTSVFGLGATAVAVWRARDPGRGGRHRAGARSAPVTGADAPGL